MIPRRVSSTAACLVLVFTSACSKEITTPAGEVMLESLRFAEAEIEVGKPLVLFAEIASGEAVGEEPFLVRTSSGASHRGSFHSQFGARSSWDALSAEDLAAVIEAWHGIVGIGFKEVAAERGVDGQGHNVTSAETVERMKEWVREQGLTIMEEWVFLPGVTGRMPGEVELVGRIRGHSNVDYLEPGATPGVPWGGTGPAPSPADLVAVIRTHNRDASGLRVQRGDVITVEYRQPNGSVLRATAAVR